MYQHYRLPGSKGYLVHTCYIPSVVEGILAYMARFGVPWFPETKATLWPIVILWQSGPCTPRTSHIGSLGQWVGVNGLLGKHMLHTLCCGMNIGVYGQVWGALVPRNEGVPLADCHFMAVWTLHPTYQQYQLPGSKGYLVHTCYIPSAVEWILACLGSQKRMPPSGRLWFFDSLDPAPYVPAISAPWVKGLFGKHMSHTLYYGMNIGVYGQVWDALVPRNEGVPLADYEFIAVWTLHPMYQQYRLPGSKGYLVHACYIPSVVEWILAYMAKFGVPWCPETKTSLWHIVILWQSGPCTLCTSNIGSLGQRAIWYTHVTYPLLWNEYWRALVPRNECLPLADCDFLAVWTLHPMYQQYRLPGSKGYLLDTCYIPSVVEWILANMTKFGVPWFQKTKATLWQIKIIWQSRPCSLCTSNIGSLGQRAIW